MLRAPAILSEIAQSAVNEIFKAYALGLRQCSEVDLDSSRACAVTVKGSAVAGLIQLAVEERLLERTSTPWERRQDLVNELTNLLAGRFESELLRRGLTIQYAPPRTVTATGLRSFDRGREGTVCHFETDAGRAAVAIRLNLERGAVLEAFPTRRLPERNVARSTFSVASRGGSASVLVVDDSASARAGIVAELVDAGFEVLEADSGLAALSVLRERPGIGMVFTDLHMAGISGAELIRKVKADEKLATVPIVVLTASPAAMEEVDAAQIVTCLIKPISPAAVISLARRILPAA